MLLSQDVFGEQPLITCALATLLGICVGSFLNVVALRSLKEQSFIFPASHCMTCEHKLEIFDNIPVISYLILGGKCRYCAASISIQYPIVELGTGIAFALIAFLFLVMKVPYSAGNGDLLTNISIALKMPDGGVSCGTMPLLNKIGLTVSMAAFVSTLIAVTITDLREKLIPHEITYPAMIFGIICSALFRQDILGTMAGIGASYILFDFLAFYGLKCYVMMHPEVGMEPLDDADAPIDFQLDRSFDIRTSSVDSDEPLEVMGGGDAVLSAVMSAYLGWQLLIVALLIGFAAGTLGGIYLLIQEMKRAGLIRDCIGRTAKFAIICGMLFAALVAGINAFFQIQSGDEINLQDLAFIKPVLMMASVGAIGGALIGIVSVGTRVSKPFPFGPALALGGLCSMFLIPFYLPFF